MAKLYGASVLIADVGASYSYWGIYPEMRMSLDLVASGKLNAKKFITQCFPLNEINTAFETAMEKDKNRSVFVGVTM